MKRYLRLLALVLAAVLLLAGACARAQEQVQALFINVGKADAALFFLDDQRFLVDTGTKDSYDQLERVLEAYGVTRLNGVVITHTDKDHVGGLKKLLKSGIAVDRVYAGALHSEKSLEDHPVYEAAEKYAVPLTWLSAGDSIALEGGGAFDVLGPLTQDDLEVFEAGAVVELDEAERLAVAHGAHPAGYGAFLDARLRGREVQVPNVQIRHEKEASSISVSKKSGCAGLFRQMLKKCLRRRRKLPARPAKPGDTNSLWRGRREAPALWAVATEGGKATRRSQPKRAADAASGRRED